MSILNRPSDGLYNILIIIYKSLTKYKQLNKDELLDLICPKSISDQKLASNTLNTWTDLGLFEIQDKSITIVEKYKLTKSKISNDNVNDIFAKLLREIIFHEENNKNFWSNEKNRASDFTRAISWILAQDVYTFNCGTYKDIEYYENIQLKNATERRQFQNDTRWSGFRSWSRYLGFAWESDTFIIDPTVAVRDNLPDVFISTKKLQQKDFFSRLSEILPVLDNGKYRKKVENELKESESWKKTRINFLSSSLSRALIRLESDGVIKMSAQSDAEGNVVTVTGKNQKAINKVSHIEYFKR